MRIGRAVALAMAVCVTGTSLVAQAPTLDALRAAAQERMRQDLKTFTPDELREIETLYQSANKDLRAPGAKDILKQLVEKYPRSNRTGCAVLYLAQISAGAEREEYLKLAIGEFGDAMYGDGVQVGALGRAFLAAHYAETGRAEQSRRTAEEIVKLFPGAVDHGGRPLVDMLRRMKLLS
jgi:hypothetical protein